MKKAAELLDLCNCNSAAVVSFNCKVSAMLTHKEKCNIREGPKHKTLSSMSDVFNLRERMQPKLLGIRCTLYVSSAGLRVLSSENRSVRQTEILVKCYSQRTFPVTDRVSSLIIPWERGNERK